MKVKDLLNIPRRWSKGANAKDDYGNSIPPEDPRAVSFCLTGAVLRCYVGDEHQLATKKLRAAILLRTGKEQSLDTFNDAPATKHEDIVAVTEIANV